jgi:hypothetical protein
MTLTGSGNFMLRMNKFSSSYILCWLGICFWISACTSQTTVPNPIQMTSTPIFHPTKTAQLTGTPEKTRTPIPTLTQPSTPTSTVIFSASSTIEPSPSPTPVILRGVVIPEKVSCRYGPGAMYLYLYGMVTGATQDIIGRTDSGQWVLTRSRGDDKACWVKAEFMKIDGDVMLVEQVYPDKIRLIKSNQGYRLPWNVVAVRNGEDVTISWESEARRPGDEESATSVLYVVETWVCRDGQLWFTPIGAYIPQVTVKDELGCQQPSYGRVFFVEKHGYTGPTDIIWPSAP